MPSKQGTQIKTKAGPFAVIGLIIGALIGGPFGAVKGAMLGATIGAAFADITLPPGPRLENQDFNDSSYGKVLPRFHKEERFEGSIIWLQNGKFEEREVVIESQGAKQIQYHYYATLAVAICEGPIKRIKRIEANDEIIYSNEGVDGEMSDGVFSLPMLSTAVGFKNETWGSSEGAVLGRGQQHVITEGTAFSSSYRRDFQKRRPSLVIYSGAYNQIPDPDIVEERGEENTPAYRGVCYVKIKNLPLSATADNTNNHPGYGNRLPTLKFIVEKADTTIETITLPQEFKYETVLPRNKPGTPEEVSGSTVFDYPYLISQSVGSNISTMERGYTKVSRSPYISPTLGWSPDSVATTYVEGSQVHRMAIFHRAWKAYNTVDRITWTAHKPGEIPVIYDGFWDASNAYSEIITSIFDVDNLIGQANYDDAIGGAARSTPSAVVVSETSHYVYPFDIPLALDQDVGYVPVYSIIPIMNTSEYFLVVWTFKANAHISSWQTTSVSPLTNSYIGIGKKLANNRVTISYANNLNLSEGHEHVLSNFPLANILQHPYGVATTNSNHFPELKHTERYKAALISNHVYFWHLNGAEESCQFTGYVPGLVRMKLPVEWAGPVPFTQGISTAIEENAGLFSIDPKTVPADNNISFLTTATVYINDDDVLRVDASNSTLYNRTLITDWTWNRGTEVTFLAPDYENNRLYGGIFTALSEANEDNYYVNTDYNKDLNPLIEGRKLYELDFIDLSIKDTLIDLPLQNILGYEQSHCWRVVTFENIRQDSVVEERVLIRHDQVIPIDNTEDGVVAYINDSDPLPDFVTSPTNPTHAKGNFQDMTFSHKIPGGYGNSWHVFPGQVTNFFAVNYLLVSGAHDRWNSFCNAFNTAGSPVRAPFHKTLVSYQAPFSNTFEDFTMELSDVVRYELLRSKLLDSSEIDVSDLDGIAVQGFAVKDRATTEQIISNLQRAYFFDLVEEDYKLKAKLRSASTVSKVLTSADLRAGELGRPAFEFKNTVPDNYKQPIDYAITYRDASQDYEPVTINIQNPLQESNASLSYPLPLVLTQEEAVRIGDIVSKVTALQARGAVEFTTHFQHSDLELADLVTLQLDDGSEYTGRVVTLDKGRPGLVKVTMKLDAPSNYISNKSNYTFTSPLSIKKAISFEPFVIDALPFEYEDNKYGVWVGAFNPQAAVDRRPLRASLIARLEGTNEPIASTSLSGLSSLGHCLNSLAEGATVGDFDYQQELTFLPRGVDYFITTTEEKALLDIYTNTFFYGSDDRWEIVKIVEFEDNADGTKTAKGFLRGYKGTAHYMKGHRLKDVLIPLNASMKRIELPWTALGKKVNFIFSSSSPGVASERQVISLFTSNNTKPLPPINPDGYKDAAGDWHIHWVRQTRIGIEWLNAGDAALDEEEELYAVLILDPADSNKIVRVLASRNPVAVYTAAEQTTDFGSIQSNITWTVAQYSTKTQAEFISTLNNHGLYAYGHFSEIVTL